MQYDLAQSPFSRRGSYLQIERGFHFDNPRVFLGSARRSIWRPINGGFGTHFFIIELDEPTPNADYDITATTSCCVATSRQHTQWRAAIADADTMVFEARGAGLRFVADHGMGWADQRSPQLVVIYDSGSHCMHHFRLLSPGRLDVLVEVDPDRPGKQGAANYIFSVRARPEAPGARVSLAYRNDADATERRLDEPVPDFDTVEAGVAREYAAWCNRMPDVLDEHRAAAEFAWFMLWNQEAPRGDAMTRRGILMSRFWMNCVWAWDACFDAMGVGAADPQLAWDQVLLHFDHQKADGQLPDSVDDRNARYGYVKPPVQGWTAMRLIDDMGVEASVDCIRELYEPLLAWTRWWYEKRCDRADGLCKYQHGNDSGWDNATVFAQPGPVISPDLQALLANQWQALARIATIVGRRAEAERHRQRARQQVDAMQKSLVVDGRLGYLDPAGRLHPSTSTLTRMPILLGRDLAPDLRDNLVADLSPASPHITKFGPATEATDSPHYLDDGYWRGPIWAPEAWMAIDGLRRAGADEQSRDLAERFCKLCNGPEAAMHENFDALTGKGLRSPAYSWTAAVYLLAARQLHTERTAAAAAHQPTAPTVRLVTPQPWIRPAKA